MPSTTHNKRLRELLKDALRMLGGNEQYMDSLHDFMKRHIAFCAFTLDNAYAISTADIRKMADTYVGYIDLHRSNGRLGNPLLYRYC